MNLYFRAAYPVGIGRKQYQNEGGHDMRKKFLRHENVIGLGGWMLGDG